MCSAIIAPQREERKLPAAIPNMKPAKAGQPYSAAINHVIVGQVLHSPALNEGHVLVNPPYSELLNCQIQRIHLSDVLSSTSIPGENPPVGGRP